MTVVSLPDVKTHLNIDHEGDDVLLSGFIKAAEAFVSPWLPVPLADMPTVPEDLKQAVKMLVGHWYENREASLPGLSSAPTPIGFWDIINGYREYVF